MVCVCRCLQVVLCFWNGNKLTRYQPYIFTYHTMIRKLIYAVAALLPVFSLSATENTTAPSVLAPQESGYPEQIVMYTVEPNGKERLKTPVARYKDKEGRIVDLVGAVHLGNASYYKKLNRAFARYDKVLYEMVDGEDLPEITRISRKVAAGTATPEEMQLFQQYIKKQQERGGAAGLLGTYYAYMAEMMQLSLQSEMIDYGRTNWVYADMSMEEFSAAMEARGESWMTLVWDSLRDGSFSGSGSAYASSPESLRRSVAKMLAAQSASSRSEQRAIIVSRNERCFEVLDRLMQTEPETRRMAIFYGAMHLRDMHKRLLDRGFELQGVQWVTAIVVN